MMAALSLRFAPEVRSPLAPWILYAIGIAARIGFTPRPDCSVTSGMSSRPSPRHPATSSY